MISTRRLTDLLMKCDFTWQELEQLCGGYLDLRGERMEMVLGNGTGAWQKRLGDLVAWADRQGLLNELWRGMLHYGAGKRVVQDWILDGGDMENGGASGTDLDRLEKKIDKLLDRHIEMERRLATVESRLMPQPINWMYIFLALITGLILAGSTTFMAVAR